jgi:hypothetical protein
MARAIHSPQAPTSEQRASADELRVLELWYENNRFVGSLRHKPHPVAGRACKKNFRSRSCLLHRG